MLCECRHIQANLSCGSWTKAEQIQQPLGLDLGNWEASCWAQVVRLVQSFSQFLRGKLKTWQYHHEFFLSCFLLAVLEFWMLYRLYRLYDLIWGASWVHATQRPTPRDMQPGGLGAERPSRIKSHEQFAFGHFSEFSHHFPRSWFERPTFMATNNVSNLAEVLERQTGDVRWIWQKNQKDLVKDGKFEKSWWEGVKGPSSGVAQQGMLSHLRQTWQLSLLPPTHVFPGPRHRSRGKSTGLGEERKMEQFQIKNHVGKSFMIVFQFRKSCLCPSGILWLLSCLLCFCCYFRFHCAGSLHFCRCALMVAIAFIGAFLLSAS